MKRPFQASMIIMGLLISACSAQPTEPSIRAEDIQLTSIAAAFTIVAETHAAIPTKTLIPLTETLIPMSLPTDAPLPSPSFDPLLVTPTTIPSTTPQSSTSTNDDPCNQPLLSWKGPSAGLNIVYEYQPKTKEDVVVVSLWVMTDLGECGYLYDLSTGPVGQYSAAVYVDGKKDFKVFGGFRITEGNWKLVIRNDTVVALGVCYPNC